MTSRFASLNKDALILLLETLCPTFHFNLIIKETNDSWIAFIIEIYLKESSSQFKVFSFKTDLMQDNLEYFQLLIQILKCRMTGEEEESYLKILEKKSDNENLEFHQDSDRWAFSICFAGYSYGPRYAIGLSFKEKQYSIHFFDGCFSDTDIQFSAPLVRCNLSSLIQVLEILVTERGKQLEKKKTKIKPILEAED